MKIFTGKTLRWEWREGVIELTLDHAPANEIGTAMLAELGKFVASFESLASDTAVCIIASARKSVFSAGGDLRELYADRKSTRLNSSHDQISYAVFCLKKKIPKV